MRDPDRILRIISVLHDIWTQPGMTDMRLGQLLVNATGITGDMFFIEDDDMEKALREFKRQYIDGIKVA